MSEHGNGRPPWLRVPTIAEVIALAGILWGAASLVANLRATQTILQQTVISQAELTRTVNALVTRVEVIDTRVRVLEEMRRR